MCNPLARRELAVPMLLFDFLRPAALPKLVFKLLQLSDQRSHVIGRRLSHHCILVSMSGLDVRALRAAWTVFLFLLAIALVYVIGHTLVVFTLAIFLAHLLAPIVERVERYLPRRMSRTLALALVYFILLGVATAIIVPVGARVTEQAAALAARLPAAFENDPLARIPLPGWLEDQRPRLTEMLRERVQELDQTVLPMLQGIGSQLLSGIGNVLAAILIPILSFFFLKDGRQIHDSIVRSFAPEDQLVARSIFADLHLLLIQYIRALVILAAVVFAVYALFFSATGVPYAILLAAVSGLLEFIPVAGPLVSSIAVLLVAGLTGYEHLAWVAVFLVVFRLFQDYVVNPHLMSAGVEIHPLLVLFGVLAGEQVAGIPGMFFSVPVIAALRIVVLRLRRARTVEAPAHV
jgi:predicted PurR-regulated permease PerM